MNRRQAAFTLFEVLIAVFILSIGLLGLASLQTAGMRNNNSAYMRSQATALAYDIGDRIRANRLGDYITPLPNGSATATCLTTGGCSPDQMAANDIYEWQRTIKGDATTTPPITPALPMGSGTISRNAGTGIYTVSISWDDSFSGTAGRTFTTQFLP